MPKCKLLAVYIQYDFIYFVGAKMKLDEKLVSLRKAKGLSQMKLAEMMNVSRQAISRWEVGTAVPSTENLKYLGRLYDVPSEYLLYEDAPEPSIDSVANIASNDEEVTPKKVLRRRLLIIAALLVLVAGMVICICIHKNKEEIAPIEALADDADWRKTEVDKFSLDW